MDASHVADVIVSSVKKSKLNFHITELPFSLLINLRKTFIKDKNGNSLLPLIDTFGNVVANEVKVEDEEKSRLNVSLGKLDAELNETRNALLEEQMKANKFAKDAQKQQNSNDELRKDIETLRADMNTSMKNLKSKDNEIKRLETKNNNLEEQLKKKKTENKCLLDENKNICDEKKNLETQIVSLKKPVTKNIHKSTSTSTATMIESQAQTEAKSIFSILQSMNALHIRLDIESSPSLDKDDNPPGPGPVYCLTTSVSAGVNMSLSVSSESQGLPLPPP